MTLFYDLLIFIALIAVLYVLNRYVSLPSVIKATLNLVLTVVIMLWFAKMVNVKLSSMGV